MDLPVHHFRAGDGLELAYRELGTGRPLVLIHGYFSTATVNWLKYGHAQALAARGFRVIMPDLRGHGDSAKPRDIEAYPPDVLAEDGEALLAHLGLGRPGTADYDLGGYSLGGRTALRMLVRGARPRRAIVAGMGLSGVLDTHARSEHFRHILTNLGQHQRGTPEFLAEAFLKTVGGDPVALLHVLETFVDTTPEELASIDVPTASIMGAEDIDNGSGPDLAAALGAGAFVEIPGTHMSAVVKPDLATAIGDFLTASGTS